MSRHTITEEELDAWLDRDFWQRAASSHGRGTSKIFEMNASGVFRVTDHSKVVYHGLDKKAAIAAYNAAP